ncbi:hypothetical protein ABZ424_11075, partial [Streptomyces sp. NPDC005790]
MLALTDQFTRHVDVDAAVIQELKRLFGETGTVEAVATVAAYNMVSRFLVALAIRTARAGGRRPPGSGEVRSWLPAGGHLWVGPAVRRLFIFT